jgi:putative transposase
MVRPLRIQYPGAVYHVTCRGNERRNIFRNDEDRQEFLRLLSLSLNIYSVKLFAYVLMNNHFHLLVETPLGNLGEFMRRFNITYTGYFNRSSRRTGHLYQGRYKSVLVEREAYLSALSRYIHLNPIRVMHLAKKTVEERLDKLLRHRWSSLHGYLDGKGGEEFVNYTLVLADYGGDTRSSRNAYRKRLITDITRGLEVKSDIFAQSVLGGDTFIRWVKETFLTENQSQEQPSAGKIKHYQKKETILECIENQTGKDLDSLKNEKGDLRRITMELLYRYGGLKGPEIGALFGLVYSAVSQERKRLRERIAQDNSLLEVLEGLEKCLSTMKI